MAMKRGLHIDVTIPEQLNLTSYILEPTSPRAEVTR